MKSIDLPDKNLVLTVEQLCVASGWGTLSPNRNNFLWISLMNLCFNHSH
jgi:hypothetical protein